MKNSEFIREFIIESLKSMGEGTNHCNEVALEDIQDQPGVGKPGVHSLEDHIKMLKEEREILIEKLQNTEL